MRTLVLTENKNTKDDLEESLRIAAEQGFGRVAIITVAVHVPRSEEFFNLVQKEGKIPRDIQVEFLASEEILARRNKKYRRIFESVKGTPAYTRTVAKEQEGITKLRGGRYKPKSQGYTF